jgi:uncharacterized protein
MFQARRALALVLASFALAFPTAVAAQLPKPTGPVNDFAGVLSEAAERELTELLRSVESDTTVEIAVAAVASLEGLPIEEYATKLFNAWGVGQAGKDNGVLVVVDPTSRSMRIEVGYGLEPILPDGLAGAIIRRDFEPAFKAGDYNAGMLSGIGRLAEVVRKQHPLSVEERRNLAAAERQAELDAREPPAWVLEVVAGVIIAFTMFIAGMGFRTSSTSLLGFGCFFGGPLLFVWLRILPAHGVLSVPLALTFLSLGVFAGGRPFWMAFARRSDGDGTPGWQLRWGSGSSGSSRSSGSGSGSGGSRDGFGGGRSGGGGASGRW